MRAGKRILAVVIAACMALPSSAFPVQAQGNAQQVLREEKQAVDEQQGTNQALQEEESQQQRRAVETQEEAWQGTLQFLMQESESVQIPGAQNVVAGLGEEGAQLESAALCYVNAATGEEFTAEAFGISGNMARFSMEYGSQEQAGTYRLASIRYRSQGRLYEANLAEQGMEVSYGVNCQAQTEPDEVLLNQELLEEVEANMVTMDENGEVASQHTLGDVLGEGQAGGKGPLLRIAPKGAKDMVVVLDPGHDNTHAGASYFGYREQDLVLKIALYCREELQKYGGISIYMTRESGSCPFGGGNVTSADCNARRVEFAQSKKADVYVSFHLNASPSSSARGIGVYYPNANYRKDIWEEGKGLATSIYKSLSALGLSTWADGIVIRNSENNTTYPDGSLADYLAIIRRSKLAGFPAVLIEHAFLSNQSDVSKFLNSDAKLKKLGVADAQAIAGYYKLSPRGTAPSISWIQSRGSQKLRVKWETVADGVSYQVYRSNEQAGEYSKVATVAGDTYDDKKVSPQETYYYKVRAVFEDGAVSEYSSVHAGSPLAQPQMASVVSKAGGKLFVSWNGVENASKYELYRSESEDGDYKKVASQSSQAGSAYTDGQIERQKTYFYKVRARGGEENGFSGYSAPMSGWAIQTPEIASIRSKSSTSLELKWTQVSNTYAYRIQRSAYANKGYETIATIKTPGTVKYVDKKLKKGVKYYYRIQAINRVNGKNGVSGYCDPVVENTIIPTSIQYVKSKKNKMMEIKWVKDPNASMYRIKRSDKENGTFAKVADVKGSDTVKFVDATIESGKKYYYVVDTIVKKNGVAHFSGNSKAVGARNLGSVKVKSLQSQNNGLQISWEAVAGANGYQIVRSNTKKGSYKSIAKVKGKSTLTYTDPNVEIGECYYYKVRALHTGQVTGCGSYTAAQEKWMIDSPKGVKVSSQSPDKIKLSWSKKTGADGYKILRSTKEGSGYQIVGQTSASALTYTDTAVLPNKNYYYKVTAIGSWGLGEAAEEPAAVLGSTAVGPSKVKSITAKAEGGIVLEVKGITGAYGYEVSRSQEEGSDFEPIGEARAGESFADSGVKAGSTYYYKVRTIWMASGKKYYSGYSDVCKCFFSF